MTTGAKSFAAVGLSPYDPIVGCGYRILLADVRTVYSDGVVYSPGVFVDRDILGRVVNRTNPVLFHYTRSFSGDNVVSRCDSQPHCYGSARVF